MKIQFKMELENDETLSGRTKWKVEDIMKLLHISIETYFKTIDGKIYFQRDGLPIGNRFRSHWQVFTCIGLRGILFTTKINPQSMV